MSNSIPYSSLGTGILEKIQNPNMNKMVTDKNPRSSVPPFLLNFEFIIGTCTIVRLTLVIPPMLFLFQYARS
jgi:hypothetical protein